MSPRRLVALLLLLCAGPAVAQVAPSTAVPSKTYVDTQLSTKLTTPGAWTNYTPTVASSAGAITSVTASGRYQVLGKSLDLRARIEITTAGAGANGILSFTLPAGLTVGGVAYCSGGGREDATTGKGLQPYAAQGQGAVTVRSYDNGSVASDGAVLHVTMRCEIQ